jgi:hypothetical protein
MAEDIQPMADAFDKLKTDVRVLEAELSELRGDGVLDKLFKFKVGDFVKTKLPFKIEDDSNWIQTFGMVIYRVLDQCHGVGVQKSYKIRFIRSNQENGKVETIVHRDLFTINEIELELVPAGISRLNMDPPLSPNDEVL